jgi:signal peptidase I
MPLLLALLVGVVVVLLPLSALTIWIIAKLMKLPKATYLRSLALASIISVANVIIGLPAYLWEMSQPIWPPTSPAVLLALAFAPLIISLALQWYLYRRGFECSGGRAAGLMGISMIVNFTLGLTLALGIRQFAMEAFIIPTGSMAPTVVGAHGEVTCGNCGHQYCVSMSDRMMVLEDRRGKVEAKTANCPNCGQTNELPASAPIYSGDRILVEKFDSARRWDPVAYVEPDHGENYFHRLVELPGESLAIADGDVFINGKRAVKPPNEVDDLWFFVHDTAFAPKNVLPDSPQWKPAAADSGWQTADGKWSFAGERDAPGELVFAGKITSANAYNAFSQGRQWSSAPQNLGDVRIDCRLSSLPAAASWGGRWRFGGTEVIAQIKDRSCTLSAKLADGTEKIAEPGKLPVAPIKRSATTGVVTFAVRDGQASVLVDGRLISSLEIAPSDLSLRQRAGSEAPGEVALFATGGTLVIDRIVLWRDVYYTQPDLRFGGVELRDFKLGPDEMFVLGDNSDQSKDSRYHGPFPAKSLIGVGSEIYWPPRRWHQFQ